MKPSLAAALQKLAKIEAETRKVLAKAYPIGSDLRYERGHQRYFLGEVLDHSMFGVRVRVRNLATGKDYWIDAGSIQ